MKLLYKKLTPDAFPPTKERDSLDAGWDVRSRERKVLRLGEIYTFSLGLALALHLGEEEEKAWARLGLSWYWRAADKSGLARDKGIHVLGGVIDRQFRGDVGIVLGNFGFVRYGVLMGDDVEIGIESKICQIVPEMIADVREAEAVVSDFEPTDRGANGFGSTGR